MGTMEMKAEKPAVMALLILVLIWGNRNQYIKNNSKSSSSSNNNKNLRSNILLHKDDVLQLICHLLVIIFMILRISWIYLDHHRILVGPVGICMNLFVTQVELLPKLLPRKVITVMKIQQ